MCVYIDIYTFVYIYIYTDILHTHICMCMYKSLYTHRHELLDMNL